MRHLFSNTNSGTSSGSGNNSGVITSHDSQLWLTGALIALLLANLLALGLISLKMPGIGNSQMIQQLFRQVLVYHVNLSMLYWMPLIACALWVKTFKINNNVKTVAFALCVLSAVLLVLSSFSTINNSVLSNYVPVRDATVFLTAISCQFISVSLVATASLLGDWRDDDLFKRCLRLAALCWLIAVLSIPYSYAILPQSNEGQFEQLFWAYGHIQQAANALLIAAFWAWVINVRLTKTYAFLLVIVPVSVIGCLIAMFCEQLDYRLLFTLQMSIVSWLPLLLVTVKLTANDFTNPLLILSIFLGCLGIVTGLLITPGSLTIPAHYHGMTGAFNLAAIAYFLPANSQSWSKWYPYCYGIGLCLLIGGLTWAGDLGVARKLAGEAQQLTSLNHQLAMVTLAVGAFIAISSSIMIIITHFSKLRNNPNFENTTLAKTAL